MKTPKQWKVPAEVQLRLGCDGGVNLKDDKSGIEDNQQSELLNMWYDGGALTLRPALCRRITHEYGRIIDYYPKNGASLLLKRVEKDNVTADEKYGMYLITEHAILTFDGNELWRVPDSVAYINGAWSPQYLDHDFSSCALVTAKNGETSAVDARGSAWVVHGSRVYLFYGKDFFVVGPILYTDMVTQQTTAEIMLSTLAPHTPVIRTGCAPAGGGDPAEARNLLSPAVSQCFTTDDKNTVYRLYDKGIDSAPVTAVYDPVTGPSLVFSFFYGVNAASAGGIFVTLDRAAGTLSFSAPLVNASAYKLTDNLQVTYSKTVYPDCPICRCTIAEWFGSSAGSGGTRLFLAGNPSAGASLYYSADNDPTYFPEDCVQTVGDPADPITAFGQLFDALLVFKGSAIYAMELSGSGRAAAGVKAVAASCGCDMPGSIQMVNDRLVFANTSGGVFAVGSTLVKDERVVVPVSRNIEPALLAAEKDTLAGAVSADTGRQYLLFAGDQVFVWDYARFPLPKTAGEKDVRGLAWYIWRLPAKICGAFMWQGELLAYDDNGTVYGFDRQRSVDDAGWFDAYFYTRLHDFDLPLAMKTCFRCWVRFICGQNVILWLSLWNGAETKRMVSLAPEDCTAPLRFDPGFGRTQGFMAGVARSADDSGSFGVSEIYCSARPLGTG